MRIGLQLDDGSVRELVAHLEPTNGEADTPRRAAWVEAVIENEIALTTCLEGLERGEHHLRLYRIDDNVVLQALLFGRDDGGAATLAEAPN